MTSLSIYREVENWEDLCITNVMFLKGDISRAFYTSFYDGLNKETTELIPDLIALNLSGIYTTISQPYVNGNVCKISYVQFHCAYSVAMKLLPLLLMDNDIYFAIHSVSNERPMYINTLPTNTFKVSMDDNKYVKKQFINLSNNISEPERLAIACGLSNIFGLLHNAVQITITGKSFGDNICVVSKLKKICGTVR